jgi:hypothetical protein
MASDKQFRVSIDPQANRKLSNHLEFLSRVSEPAALRLYDAFVEALDKIGANAESYPKYLTKRQSDLVFQYLLFGKRYRIVFRVSGEDVFVHDIQDCRQDDDKNLV